MEPALDLLHVLLVLDDREDGRVGRRPPDAVLLQLLHQRGLGESRRRLGEVLLGEETLPHQPEPLALGELGQLNVALVAPGLVGAGLLSVRFLLGGRRHPVHREVAGELEDRARGPERRPTRGDLHHRLVVDRGLHLTGHEAVPDELVEPCHVRLEEGPDPLGRPLHRHRTDRLVRVLGALPALVDHRLARAAPPCRRCSAMYVARHLHRVVREAHRVGAHVRDERGLPLVTELDALVQPLGEGHRLLRGEVEPVRRLLLELAGDERRRRVPPALASLDRRHPVARPSAAPRGARRRSPGPEPRPSSRPASPGGRGTPAAPCPPARASSVQYSTGTNALISRSRSTISRTATDCTRPAESPRRTFFQSSGLIW